MRRHARTEGFPEPEFDPSQPLRGEFDFRKQTDKIKKMGVELGRGVILDRRGLNDRDFGLLREAIEREGMSGDVIWYP